MRRIPYANPDARAREERWRLLSFILECAEHQADADGRVDAEDLARAVGETVERLLSATAPVKSDAYRLPLVRGATRRWAGGWSVAELRAEVARLWLSLVGEPRSSAMSPAEFRAALRALGWTQAQAGDYLVGRVSVSAWATGRQPVPEWVARHLRQALGLGVDDPWPTAAHSHAPQTGGVGVAGGSGSG